MNPRTSRTSERRPRGCRPARRRDLATALALVVGAGSLLSFDVVADGFVGDLPPQEPAAPAAEASDRGVDLRPGGVGLATTLRTVSTARPDADVLAAERAAQRAETQRSAAEAAARQAEEEERARARAAAERAAIWDRLADCESGRWDRDKRPVEGSARWSYGLAAGEDGFFQGGLQFHPVTWDEFRDPGMPEHAGQASREQQIAIAERVLDVQGWQAWPVCSRKLGYR